MVKSQIPKNSGRTVNFPMNSMKSKRRKPCGLERPVKTLRRWRFTEARTLNLSCFLHSRNMLGSRLKPKPGFQ